MTLAVSFAVHESAFALTLETIGTIGTRLVLSTIRDVVVAKLEAGTSPGGIPAAATKLFWLV